MILLQVGHEVGGPVVVLRVDEARAFLRRQDEAHQRARPDDVVQSVSKVFADRVTDVEDDERPCRRRLCERRRAGHRRWHGRGRRAERDSEPST